MRRKQRFSWFPSLGQEPNEGVLAEGDFLSFVTGTLHPTVADPAPMDIVSLTWDYPPEVGEELADQIPTLADFQGSEYQLERVVGKLHAGIRGTAIDQSGAPEVLGLLAAALIILKVDEKTGAPLRSGDLSEYSPLISENISDPWIWRRTWVLGSDFIHPALQVGRPPRFPQSTGLYGDGESGPHMDARSVRRVRREERVFLITQMMRLQLDLSPEATLEGEVAPTIDYMFDYRILGKLVKASARGNTSR